MADEFKNDYNGGQQDNQQNYRQSEYYIGHDTANNFIPPHNGSKNPYSVYSEQNNRYTGDSNIYDKSSPYYNEQYIQPQNVPAKKGGGLKIALWCICAVLCVFAAAVFIFALQINTDGIQKPSENPQVPYNKETSSTFVSEPSIPDAPKVGANENGPQISTLEPKTSGTTNSVNRAYKKASPSVVCITSYQAGSDYTITQSGEGSGIIITSDGYIATNSHVVNDSDDTGVMITLSGGEQYLGTIIGIDRKTDLAVIKIDASSLTAAEFADSDDIFVGEAAYAIGNPGGSTFSNSLTTGTVSAVNRVLSTNGYVKYIQTDAAINPGNSGGALVNDEGIVIGMNTAKLVATDYEGMGFAIPSNTLVEIVNKIIKYGYINDRGTLGIDGSTSTLYNAKINNIPQGMIISKISSDSPLNSTEVKVNDIITAINGKKITTVNEFVDVLKKFKPGETVTLSIFRASSRSNGDAATFEVKVTLIPDTGK